MIFQQIATAFHPNGAQSLILLTPSGIVYEMIWLPSGDNGVWSKPHLLNTEVVK